MNDTVKSKRKVMVICAKGNLEDVYAALMLANGAVMEGIDAKLFFTFWGLDAITKSKMNKIKAAVIGNPSLPMPTLMGLIPWLSAFMSKIMYKQMDELDIPPVEEFLDMLDAGGGEVYACKAAVDMFKLKKEDLWDNVKGIITVGDFYNLSEGAQIIFT